MPAEGDRWVPPFYGADLEIALGLSSRRGKGAKIDAVLRLPNTSQRVERATLQFTGFAKRLLGSRYISAQMSKVSEVAERNASLKRSPSRVASSASVAIDSPL